MKKRNIYHWLLGGALLFTIVSCVQKPEYPDVPIIKFESLSKNRVNQFNDSLLITLSYTDGDGDLRYPEGYRGSNIFIIDSPLGEVLGRLGDTNVVIDPFQDTNTTVLNVLITDNRTDYTYGQFNLPTFKEGEVEQENISGYIYINASVFTCLPNRTQNIDTITLDISILDRAENRSNIVTTPPIFINCN